MSSQLVILRHGFSEWNAKNLFTGWVDVPLTEAGRLEAKRAGQVLSDFGFTPDVVFTSVLDRAIETADIAIKELDNPDIEAYRSWRLNERHYGALTGLDKKETVDKFGEDQIMLWRRSYDVAPPPVLPGSPYDFSNDQLYADVPSALIPKTECLKNVLERVEPYFEETIVPELLKSKKVLIVAHGNSLRALIMKLENLASDDISKFELPTATPRLYEFTDDLKVSTARYIEDENIVKERANTVKNQTSK